MRRRYSSSVLRRLRLCYGEQAPGLCKDLCWRGYALSLLKVRHATGYVALFHNLPLCRLRLCIANTSYTANAKSTPTRAQLRIATLCRGEACAYVWGPEEAGASCGAAEQRVAQASPLL